MEKMEAELLVVASGPAGLAAAVTAGEQGKDVLVFEKAETTGGVFNMAMGPFGVESRVQKRVRLKPAATTLMAPIMTTAPFEKQARASDALRQPVRERAATEHMDTVARLHTPDIYPAQVSAKITRQTMSCTDMGVPPWRHLDRISIARGRRACPTSV